jgi:hypothetical protein
MTSKTGTGGALSPAEQVALLAYVSHGPTPQSTSEEWQASRAIMLWHIRMRAHQAKVRHAH